MDSCYAVNKQLEKLLEKYESVSNRDQQTIEEYIAAITNFKRELLERPREEFISDEVKDYMIGFVNQAKLAVAGISTAHKELYVPISKFGKCIDKNFISDFSAVIIEGAFDGDRRQRLLNEVICEHFLRQGMLDIAECLNEDAHIELSHERREPFLELHRILEALRQRNLDPALEWTEQNRDELNRRNSTLEFKLHRLRFIELIRHGAIRRTEILEYARKLALFAHMHTKDLQLLMGSLLYLKQGIETSTYSFLLGDSNWIEICDLFTRDACAIFGLSVESPLCVGINAGCKALPPLVSIRQIMQASHVTGIWSNAEELPVEIDLGHDYRFHSIFACPILRQQSTEQNPPMRLVCGHVISKDALYKLAVGNSNRFKCPYCPVEMMTTDTRQIYF